MEGFRVQEDTLQLPKRIRFYDVCGTILMLTGLIACFMPMFVNAGENRALVALLWITAIMSFGSGSLLIAGTKLFTRLGHGSLLCEALLDQKVFDEQLRTIADKMWKFGDTQNQLQRMVHESPADDEDLYERLAVVTKEYDDLKKVFFLVCNAGEQREYKVLKNEAGRYSVKLYLSKRGAA